jgi:sulfoxide reductase heme-binding subunit YedZ
LSKTVAMIDRPLLVWLALALPGAYWLVGYQQGSMYYGEFLHATGGFGAQLMILTMAVTPLNVMFGTRAWTRWLVRNRRYLGVATFAYATLHAASYLLRLPLERVLHESTQIAMATGWIAWFVLLAQAATSNNGAVRLLERRWKWLHRGVYLVALLTFAHWLLTAFDPLSAWLHLAVLAAIEACRMLPRRRRVSS